MIIDREEIRPLLVVITGPTAVGKTTLAIDLAGTLSTEILSADSRQFYREMSIGTAVPSPEQLRQIRHHFIHHISVTDNYNVSRFVSDALALLDSLFKFHPVVIMTGGSGLYIDAICHGIDELPDPDPDLRRELHDEVRIHGIGSLRDKLRIADPVYYNTVDLANPVRLIRALEVCILTGKPYSSHRSHSPKSRPFRVLKIGLQLPRDVLNNRINRRVDEMMQNGLLEEVRSLLPYRNLNALNTVGYRELFHHLDGTITLSQAVTDIKTNTRRYAKRQMTWLHRDASLHWFTPDQGEKIMQFLESGNR